MEGTNIDTITLTGITARGFHGVLPQERVEGQEFRVDVTLFVPALPSDDDLESTIDYSRVADIVVESIQSGPHDLIETLAHELSVNILAFAGLAESVKITVHKPQAPIAHSFDDVAVTITRSRNV